MAPHELHREQPRVEGAPFKLFFEAGCGMVDVRDERVKFACPVCGQHITADASASGTPLECPTCFQTLIIPHAPEFGDRKLVLTAAKATNAKKFSSPVAIDAVTETTV